MKEMILECLPVVLLLPLTLTIHFMNIKPLQQGFFCDDYTLKYPYIENQTIPAYVCFTLWIVISLFIILTTQIISKSFSVRVFKDIISGALCCILLTDIAKYSVGKMRPHFLTLCNADYNNICFNEDAYYIDDDEEVLNEFYQKYVNETNVCSTENSELLREARLSFLSGHASYSFYFATFLIHFMSDHIKYLKWGSKIIPFIKLLVIMLASWISLTRINDFYHHPFDVFYGAFTGILVAFYYHGNKNTSLSRDQVVGEEVLEAQNMKTTTYIVK